MNEDLLKNLHPLEKEALQLCWKIEEFEASKLQTDTVIMASSLLSSIRKYLGTWPYN